ncbi:MFS transporter [Oculatella sp. LEGE 06141]|uniref:MFS transporter n=1 Tax=Oculatella sp. LEGE 06141 TaxID=1828648 RepID=UPI0018822441|nr:MFS transporter [Oculatella sp. LEGE 06141]MBE9181461.1 MFS transporter [Oculatella sp. LEGE 06141]
MPSSNSNVRNVAWVGAALGFYAFIAIGIAEGGLGVLIPSILNAFDLSPATVTLLFLSQVAGYIVAALASSLLVSRIGLAWMLLLASGMLTLSLLIYALTPLWSVMVVTGVLLGLGIGLIDAGINTYFANDERNAKLLGLLHAFYGVGALLGPAVATTLLSVGLNWRSVYLVIASVVGLTIAGMMWAIVFDYKPLTVRVETSDMDAVANLRLALNTPIVLMSGLLLLIYVGTEASVGNWAYSVQVISRNTPEMVAGYSISAYWLGLTLGRLGMGVAIARLGAIRTLDGSMGLLALGLAAWVLLPDQLWSLPLIGVALGAIFPTTILLTPRRVPPALVPAAIGFLTSTASLGAATVPTVVGWLANQLNLGIIPVVLLPLTGVMVILHRWLVRHAPLDSRA